MKNRGIGEGEERKAKLPRDPSWVGVLRRRASQDDGKDKAQNPCPSTPLEMRGAGGSPASTQAKRAPTPHFALQTPKTYNRCSPFDFEHVQPLR